jgi:DNA-binding MarR family transcriptional regulator
MAAVRLSRLQTRILRWLAADEQRTRGMITSSHPELVAALPSAKKGNISHSRRRLETQGLLVMLRTPGGKTDSVYLTTAGRQKASQLAGSSE